MSYINTERALLYGPDRIFSGICIRSSL